MEIEFKPLNQNNYYTKTRQVAFCDVHLGDYIVIGGIIMCVIERKYDNKETLFALECGEVSLTEPYQALHNESRMTATINVGDVNTTIGTMLFNEEEYEWYTMVAKLYFITAWKQWADADAATKLATIDRLIKQKLIKGLLTDKANEPNSRADKALTLEQHPNRQSTHNTPKPKRNN